MPWPGGAAGLGGGMGTGPGAGSRPRAGTLDIPSDLQTSFHAHLDENGEDEKLPGTTAPQWNVELFNQMARSEFLARSKREAE
mmetsp:Transcript_5798/g.8947  ORF Transcript_5798/g.8947 Transcript_5798/m.8947 type:complete len:83 (-) Transcript_5798:67-315(-)